MGLQVTGEKSGGKPPVWPIESMTVSSSWESMGRTDVLDVNFEVERGGEGRTFRTFDLPGQGLWVVADGGNDCGAIGTVLGHVVRGYAEVCSGGIERNEGDLAFLAFSDI